jgi:hypothetical protein
MPSIMFKKGQFITQNSCPKSFAIFEGDAYAPDNDRDGMDYSLTCYYNPDHCSFDDKSNKWLREFVFEYDLSTVSVCEYTINENDMVYWRLCTEDEKNDALKILAEKHQLAWDEKTNKFRKLEKNEKLFFGEKPKNTGACGGNVHTHQNPMYRTEQFHDKDKTTKKISLVVDADWEQKIPVSSMDSNRRELVANMCEKLKWAFNSYSVGSGTMVYPQNGSYQPYRYGGHNPYAYLGYDGMAAYQELMNGDDWGWYD